MSGSCIGDDFPFLQNNLIWILEMLSVGNMKAFVLGLIVVFLKFRCGNKLHKTRTQGWYQIAFCCSFIGYNYFLWHGIGMTLAKYVPMLGQCYIFTDPDEASYSMVSWSNFPVPWLAHSRHLDQPWYIACSCLHVTFKQ